MRTVHLFATSCLALAAGSACLGSAEPSGPKLSVDIAALTLTGPDNICYDLLVENATGPVWSKGNPLLTLLGADQTGGIVNGAADTDTICSTRYGNSDGGDVTYIGTCDATSDSDLGREEVQNRVTLWVDGIYKSGADLGDWQDPCEDGCSLSVDCNENEDSLVEFNLTLMRQANQGFFDIAVNFEDIFCSAKFDTCYPDGDDADTADDPIRLIHGADATRDWTGVFGFACTAGLDAATTNLMYGQIQVTCGSDVFTIDPAAGAGVDGGNASVTVGGKTLHFAVYRGLEDLDCGTGPGSCKKAFWNLALSVDDLARFGGDCNVTLAATANDSVSSFNLGVPTAIGQAYPYIALDAQVTDGGVGLCQRHRLNDSDVLKTTYRGNLGGVTAPETMCAQYKGGPVTATGGCGAPPVDPCGDINTVEITGSTITVNGAPPAPGFTLACLTTQSLELNGATIAFTPTTFPNFVGSPSSTISIHDVDSSAAIVFPVYAAGTITATNNTFASLALPVWSPANDSTFQDNAIGNVTFGLSSFQHTIALLDNLGTTFAFPNLVFAPQGDLHLQGTQDVAAAGLRTIRQLQYQFTGGTVDVSALEAADSVTVGGVLWTSYSLPLLTTVTGALSVGDNWILETLSLPNLVSAGSIALASNTALTTLDLGSLVDVSQDLVIKFNYSASLIDGLSSIALPAARLGRPRLRYLEQHGSRVDLGPSPRDGGE